MGGRFEEFGIAAADDCGMILQQPGGETAELPFGAGVRAGAEDHVETFLLGFADEFGDIEIAGKIVDAGARLVSVPEDVSGDGVKAYGFGHLETGAPVGPGNAGVVHFAGDDAEGFSIEQKLAVLHGEGAGGGGWRLGGNGRNGEEK